MSEAKGAVVAVMADGRKKYRGWTKARQAVFLSRLAETCNVRAAARAVGATPTSPYGARMRDTAFALAWDAALEAGYVRLEAELLEKAMGDAEQGIDGDPNMMKWLLVRHSAPKGRERKSPGVPKRATTAETNAAILKHLDALAKRRAKAAK